MVSRCSAGVAALDAAECLRNKNVRDKMNLPRAAYYFNRSNEVQSKKATFRMAWD